MKSPLGRLNMDVPPHYQDKLSEVIRTEKPQVVIETGLWKGLGAEFILKALDDNGTGMLFSIDPSPHREFFDNQIIHPRFAWIPEKSQDALQRFDGVDFFVHDSDHSYECQTFEYEWAWEHVKPGGIIATDDPWWGTPPHLAWSKFLNRHGLNVKDAIIIGNAMWIGR